MWGKDNSAQTSDSDAAFVLDDLTRDERRQIVLKVLRLTLIAVLASVAITVVISYSMSSSMLRDGVGLLIAVLAPAVIAPTASYSLVVMSHKLRKANDKLKSLSETDPLTGTLNRRRFVEVADRELALAQRHCFPTSVVIFDFDNFKRVNDRYGHAAGDRALVHTISVMSRVIRESDVLARFGGEEFIMLLPHTANEGALSLIERILSAVRASPIEINGAYLEITLSAGSVTCETSETPLDVLMSRADELLYESKQNGRDRATALTVSCVVPNPQSASSGDPSVEATDATLGAKSAQFESV